jgi:cysteine-rich repeat protein
MRQLQKIFLLGSLSLFSCSLLTRALGAESCDGSEVVCDGTIQKTCVNGAFELLECADSGQICDAALGGCVDENDVCGDGIITGLEQCDSDDVGGADCTDAGFDTGTLSCNNATCTFDISQCALDTCPNGNIDVGEECDGNNLGGQSCVGPGFASGALDCAANCQFDETGCVPAVCGNDIIEADEQCDSNNFGGENCNSVTAGAQPLGDLLCDPVACQIDSSQCAADTCGDGVADLNETCDDGGTANNDGCDDDCKLEVQGTCNDNNTRNGGEFCDGTDLVGKDCTDFGFVAGTLACDACNFDTAACTR